MLVKSLKKEISGIIGTEIVNEMSIDCRRYLMTDNGISKMLDHKILPGKKHKY